MRPANPQKPGISRARCCLAIVYDQNFPRLWPRAVHPHRFDREIAVADRLKFWTDSNESNALMLDLRAILGRSNLLWTRPESFEFEWQGKRQVYLFEFAKALDAAAILPNALTECSMERR
jgi:hypothetical protein